MSHHAKPATAAPYDLGGDGHRYVFGATGLRHPIVGATRRSLMIAVGPRRLRLRRRHLERHGYVWAGGHLFAISRYYVSANRRAA